MRVSKKRTVRLELIRLLDKLAAIPAGDEKWFDEIAVDKTISDNNDAAEKAKAEIAQAALRLLVDMVKDGYVNSDTPEHRNLILSQSTPQGYLTGLTIKGYLFLEELKEKEYRESMIGKIQVYTFPTLAIIVYALAGYFGEKMKEWF